MKIILILSIVISALTFSQNQSLDYNNNLDPISFKNDQSTREKRNEAPNSNNRIITNKVLLENGYILIEQIHLQGSGNTWLNYEKTDLIYNSDYKIVEKNIYNWDDSVWINGKKELYNFDVNGNDTTILKQYWIIDKWINSEKIINAFDSNNNLIQTINQNFIDSLFINLDKTDFVYDSQNNLIEEVYQYWADGNWDNRTRRSKEYNINNLVIEVIYEEWNGTEWLNDYQRLYEYDENQNKTLEMLNYWNGTEWDDHIRWISNYNPNNLISELIQDEYFENTWLHSQKDIYTYESLNLMEDKILRWSTFDWDTSSRVIYSYNSNDKCIERQFQKYRFGWEDWTRYIFEFDEFGNLKTESSYTWVFTEWVNNNKYLYNYSPITSIETDRIQSIGYLLQQNYPNPFNPGTIIRYAISSTQFVTLKVYDLLGREIATLVNEEKTAGSYNVEFGMQNLELSSGIYFYKLQAGNFVETKKMILLK